MNVIAASHRRATAIFLLIAVAAAAGIVEALRLPSSIFPAVTFPVVKVIAVTPVQLRSKTIVSPAAAVPILPHSVVAPPSSAQLVTCSVLAAWTAGAGSMRPPSSSARESATSQDRHACCRVIGSSPSLHPS